MKKTASVAIILVNWNGREHTTECLESLKELTYPGYKIILVDNGSSDDDAAYFKQNYAHLHVIALPENTGFTGGNNAGIRRAMEQNFDYVLLLNNDTLVTDPSFLSIMIHETETNAKAGMACPTIWYHKPPKKIWYAGARLNFWTGWTHYHALPDTMYPQKTGYITGCCMLVKKETIMDSGMLNESYFLSVEDVEWSLRAKKRGWHLIYIPAANIAHKDGASSRSAGKGYHSPGRIYYEWRNSIWFIREYANRVQKIVIWPAAYFFCYLYKAAAYLLLGRRKKLKAMTNGIKDGLQVPGKAFKKSF